MDIKTIEKKAIKRDALNLLDEEVLPEKLITILQRVNGLDSNALMDLGYEIKLLTALIMMKLEGLNGREVMTNDELKVINNMTKTLTTAKIEKNKIAKENAINITEMQDIIKQVIQIIEVNVPPQNITIIKAAILNQVITPRKEGLSVEGTAKLTQFAGEIESKVVEATSFESVDDIKQVKGNGSANHN